MRLIAFATDYDGTLAQDGKVEHETIEALEALRRAEHKLLLVTGRELSDLERVFDHLDLFDVVVAENGALLYFPGSQEQRPIAEVPPQTLVAELERRGVAPLSVGRGIVATWTPHEAAVLETIRDLGLEWQIIFNKGAVMVLPAGVNKATGLAAALDVLGLSPLNVVGIGDAENDHAFMTLCGCSVAVANALDAVKTTADLVTKADHGAGVREAISALLAESSNLVTSAAARTATALCDADPQSVVLRSDEGDVLIAGSSGIGKSTLATALIEKFTATGFQCLVVDPEGDYDQFAPAVVLGDAGHGPPVSEVMGVLDNPGSPPLVVNLLGVKVDDRPAYFRDLMTQVADLQGRTARPHWLVVDEAHHMLPNRDDGAETTPVFTAPAIFVTVHPDQMSSRILTGVNTVLAVGPKARAVIKAFCEAVGEHAPRVPRSTSDDAVLYWNRMKGPPRWVEVDRPAQDLKRHLRKYAEGDLADNSFYFRGPQKALNLRAQNLGMFLQIADGVDDATWLHHLKHGDYVRWFRDAIKDDDLAREAEGLTDQDDADETRAAIREIIERRYTAPARV